MAESPDTTHSQAGPTAEKHYTVELALQRFVTGNDVEALHDLRVALRRLTSLLRIFDTSQNDSYQQVRSMLKTTNRARDLEVFLLILRQLGSMPLRLEQTWRRQLVEEIQHLRQILPTSWQTVSMALPGVTEDEQNFLQLAARQLHSDILRLQQRRGRLCQEWNDRSAHKLRISGKQVRYLLELFAAQNMGIEQCIDEMKAFQDLLGEYHDYATMLIDPAINNDELPAITSTLTERMEQLHQDFTADHCLSPQMDHILLKAMHTLQSSGRNEHTDVV